MLNSGRKNHYLLNFTFNSQVGEALQNLRHTLKYVILPAIRLGQAQDDNLCWEQAINWTEQLKTVMFQYCKLGHDWQFSDEQKQLLQQYYNANKLLIDCLNSDCYLSREVRQEIEETLLLPIE